VCLIVCVITETPNRGPMFQLGTTGKCIKFVILINISLLIIFSKINWRVEFNPFSEIQLCEISVVLISYNFII
jgi:hypothetical protein